jgi:hypothetical protein
MMERTLLMLGMLALVIALASRRVRPEIPAAAALLFLLSADLIPVSDASDGLARSGLLFAVLLFADGLSPVSRALLYRWFGVDRRSAPSGMLIVALSAALMSAIAQGGRVARDLGLAPTSGADRDDPEDGIGINVRIVLLHACLFGGLLSFLGNVIYAMAGGRLSMDTAGFGLLEQAAVAVAILAVAVLVALPWLRDSGEQLRERLSLLKPEVERTDGWPIAASLVMLGWLILVEVRYVFYAETFIIGWLTSLVCSLLPFAASGFLILRGRQSPIAGRCLITALAIAMLLIPDVPALVAIGGAAVVMAMLPARPFPLGGASIEWSVPIQFALLSPVSIAYIESGIGDQVVETLLPLLEAGPFALLFGWMLLVLLLANACGSIFAFVMLMPLGSTLGAIYGDPNIALALFSLAMVGAAAASLAPDLWGKRLIELNISPREHWQPLLIGQAIVLFASVLVVWVLYAS